MVGHERVFCSGMRDPGRGQDLELLHHQCWGARNLVVQGCEAQNERLLVEYKK